MFCTNCGRELQPDDGFCSKCGTATGASQPQRQVQQKRRLTRSVRNKKIAGVCGGVAEYFEIDVTLVRILWLVAVLGVGTGVLAYVVCWIVMPREEIQVVPAGAPQRV